MTFARTATIALTICTAFLVACPDKSTKSPDGGALDSRVDAGPPELTFRIVGQVADAGTELELPAEADAPALVPQLQGLRIESNVPLRNYRIRVFDELDRAMVSDDVAHEDPTGTRYEITFPAPLKPGHNYVVAVEAETGVQFADFFGRLHPDLRFPLQVEGEKQKDPPPEKPKKKTRRRR